MGDILGAVGSVGGALLGNAILPGLGGVIGGSLGGSIGGAIDGGGGGGSPTGGTFTSGAPGTAPQYVLGGQPGADQLYQQLFVNQAHGQNYPQENYGAMSGLYDKLASNPYAASEQKMAGLASDSAFATGANDTAASGNLFSASASTLPYANQALLSGFDPQNALYNRTVQQVQDQVNASNSMYGLGTSPVGASIAGDKLANFNIDWQNQQLNRQGQGARTAADILSSGSNLATAGGNIGNAGTAATNSAGTIPNAAFTGNINSLLSALGGLNTAGMQTQTMPNNIAGLLQSYLGLGQSSNQLAGASAQNAFNNAGSTASGLNNMLSGMNGGNSIMNNNPTWSAPTGDAQLPWLATPSDAQLPWASTGPSFSGDTALPWLTGG